MPAGLMLIAAADPDFSAGFGVLGLFVLVIVAITLYHFRAQKREGVHHAAAVNAARQRAELESRAQSEQAEINHLLADKVRTEVELLKLQVQAAQRDLNNPLVQEHQDLVARRTRRELELLDLQIRLASRDLESRPDGQEYERVVMSKARLEIESLRLQIHEQRKRLDDFGQYGDH